MTGERDNLVAGLPRAITVNNAPTTVRTTTSTLPNNELKTRALRRIGATSAMRTSVWLFPRLPFSHYASPTETAVEPICRNHERREQGHDRPRSTVATNANSDYDEAADAGALQPDSAAMACTLVPTGSQCRTRSAAPAGPWGYPCFRNDAISDRPTVHGRSDSRRPRAFTELPMTPRICGIAKANTNQSVTMVSGNESFDERRGRCRRPHEYIVSFAGDTTGWQQTPVGVQLRGNYVTRRVLHVSLSSTSR